MIKLRISVTKDVLEKTKNCSPSADIAVTNCAIAYSVREIFPTAYVFSYAICLTGGHIILPEAASNFIISFDSLSPEERVKMKPFSFDIQIPDPIVNQINIDEIRPLLENHPTLQLIEA